MVWCHVENYTESAGRSSGFRQAKCSRHSPTMRVPLSGLSGLRGFRFRVLLDESFEPGQVPKEELSNGDAYQAQRIRAVAEFYENPSKADISQWFAAGGDELLTYADTQTTHLMTKLSTQGVKALGECADVQRGVTPFNLTDKNRWATSRPAFDGTVRRYTLERGPHGYIRFDDTLAEPKPERYFKGPRLLLRELISRQFHLQAVKAEEDFVTNKSMQSILRSVGGPDLEYLLGCLNSRLMSWYFLLRSNIAQRDDFPKIVLKETRSLPIPLLTAKNAKEAKELSNEVKQMLALQVKLSSTQSERESEKLKRQIVATDNRIDHIVYGLYGLTEGEVAIVEKAAPPPEDVQ